MDKRGKVLFFLTFGIIFLLSSFLSATTYTCNSVPTCNSAISGAASGDVVQMTQPITYSQNGTAIDFQGIDNIIFDCAGFSITGPGNSNNTNWGIYFDYLGGGSQNDTVENCNVSKFWTAIYIHTYSNSSRIFNTTTSRSYGGIVVLSSKNLLDNLTVSNSSNIGVSLSSSNSNRFYNINSSFNGNAGFFLSSNSNNNTFVNITSIGNKANAGIDFTGSNNNSLINAVSNGNIQWGIQLSGASNNTLKNIITDSNSQYGVYVSYSSNNNLIQNASASNSQYGFYIYTTCGYNNFTGLTAYSNSQSGVYTFSGIANNTFSGLNLTNNNMGIYFIQSSYNNVSDSNISSNKYGIYITTSSNYNNFYSSNIWNSTFFGIDMGSSSGNNTFYDNFLNNSNNYYNGSVALANYFNSTLTTGTNILKGPYIGGNFWANPSGTGFSQTCTDSDGNGICDSSYLLMDGISNDYLPLSSNQPVLCSSVPTCNSAIASAGSGDTILLNQSITYTQNGTAIDFAGKDDVTFDCQGHSITGPGNSNNTNYGIYVSGSNHTNVQNCDVRGFYYGFYNFNSNNNSFDNLTAFDNSIGEILVYLGSNNYFNNISAGNNSITSTILVIDSSSYNNTFANVKTTGGYNGLAIAANAYAAEPGKVPENNTIINATFSGASQSGFSIINASNNIFKNIIVKSITSNGVLYSTGLNNSIDNLTVTDSPTGIFLQGGNNGYNKLSNIKVSSGSIGLQISSQYNSVVNVTVYNMSSNGILLSNSYNNITNATLISSHTGLGVSGGNNIINDSYISNNSLYGISVAMTGNRIYNNIINSTNNLINSGYTNYYNTTLTSGTNIFGGGYIGGNYWANFSAPGTGFSETCTDSDKDGICDSAYSLGGSNYDYLPLSNVQTSYCDSVSSCNSAISSVNPGSVVKMNQSINYNQNGTAIDFAGSDNVTFDCQGHSITGPGNSNNTNYGIYLNNSNGGSNYDTVENCNVSGFYHGVNIDTSSHNTLLNVNSINASADGIKIFLGDYNLINGSHIYGSGQYGVVVSSGSYNNLININSTARTYDGVVITGGSGNKMLNSTSSYNSEYGVYIYSSSNNTVTNITSNSNQYGLYLSNTNNNTFSNITANSNTNSGFFLSSSSGNNFTSLKAFNGGGYGFMFSSSSNNNLLSNLTSYSNGDIGLGMQYCSGNTLENNNVSGNNPNLQIYASSLSQFSNSINPSNIVDYDYRIYYNTSISNYVFNQTTAPNAGTLICANCSNITVENLNLSHNNWYSLYFYGVSNSLIRNVTSNNNNPGGLNGYGFYLSNSPNNTLDNLTAENNGYGLELYYASSSNNTLKNIFLRQNKVLGFGIFGSSNNTLTNISSYLDAGNEFSSSSNNVVSNLNITTKSGGLGIIFYSSSNNNTLFDSIISGNGRGLWFNSGYNNTFYNNLFNNTVNYYNQTSALTNYFNTTLTTGINILGGPYVGGNYWTNPSGTGFSDTCTDANGDGVCDSSYSFNGSIDYLPLSSTQPITCDSVASCNSAIASASGGDTIILTKSLNLTNASQPITAIDFAGKDNITFDCAGNYIMGPGISNPNNFGIYFNSSNGGSNDDTLANCNVSNFYDGVYIPTGSRDIIENSSFSLNYFGLDVNSLSNGTFTNLTANSNGYGLRLSSSQGSVLRNNNMTNNSMANFYIYAAYNYQIQADIDASNVVDYNKSIYYNYSIANYTFDPTTAPNAGIIICGSCDNITIRDLNLTYHNGMSIGFFNVTNSKIENVTSLQMFLQDVRNSVVKGNNVTSISNNNNDIYFTSTSSGFTTNNTVYDNNVSKGYNGIVLSLGSISNNTIANNTVHSTFGDGIHLGVSHNNTVFNNIIYSTSRDGIALSNSYLNEILNNVIHSNFEYGISFQAASYNNTASNNTIYSNGYGIYFAGSDNNTIKNSNISDSVYYGLDIQTSNNNYFYDNLFNNTANYFNTTVGLNNSFNTTLQFGVNVLKGIKIGGNYWTNPSGTGFSDTCTDANGDGICDSAYSFNGSVDYLPLSSTQPISCDSVSSCNAAIASASSGDTVYLVSNINYTQDGTAIDFAGKDNVTFDCLGNTIIGPTDSNSANIGIYLNNTNGGSNYDTVSNCNMVGFYYGIWAETSSNAKIVNSTTTSVEMFGIALSSSSNSSLADINSSNGKNGNGYGIYVVYGSNNTISNVITNYHSGGDGVYLSSTSNNTLTNITSNSNYNGIDMLYSSGNKISNSTANSNSYGGVYIETSSSGNIVRDLTVNSNLYGIYLFSNSNNTLERSNAYNNTYGIYLSSSANNTLMNNTLVNSTLYLSSSNNNSLTGNTLANLSVGIGIFLSSSSYNNISNNDFSNLGTGIRLFTSSNGNNITNNHLNSSGQGIQFLGSNYNSVSGNNITSSLHGFYIDAASNSSNFSNNKIINSTSDVIYVTGNSRYNSFSSNTVLDSKGNGVYMSGSSNNTFLNNSFTNVSSVRLYLGSNNTFTGNNVTNSSYGFLLLQNSTGNILSNNTLRNFLYQGISFQSGSDNNIVSGDRVINSSQYGIYFSSSNNNLFYNNFFNNTLNYYNATSSLVNYFNTTLTAGTNIIGGSQIGGNYWTTPSGTGYSDNCTDVNDDGICDVSYILGGSSYDSLALTYTLALPDIAFNAGTTMATGNYSGYYIYGNVTAAGNGGGLKDITIYIYNSTGLVRSNVSQSGTFFSNFTGLSGGIYYLNGSAANSKGALSVTSVNTINLDHTPPRLNILNPQAQYYGTNVSLYLNYTSVDAGVGIGNCWYSVQNSTGAFIVSNTSLSECSNSTFDVTGGGSYTLNLYSNDSFGNLNSSSVTFAVTLDGPVIVLNSPSDNSWFLNGTNLDFNFTANDATTITNCSVYTNSTGSWALNKTITSITLGVPVTTNLNFSDNSFYVWNVRCYDDSNYNQFALNNRTLGIDNIAPSIENLSVTTTSGSKTISFMSNESDNLKLKDCFYTIYDSTQSVDGSNDNVTFSCNSKVSATVTDYGNYNLTVYTEDYVGNLNSTETNFTTVAPAPTSPASSGGSGGGGGGGVPVTTKTVSVTKSFPFIQSGAPAVMDINSNTTGIEFSRISITTNRTLVNSAVTVSESNVSTSDLQIAGPGTTYQSFKINTSVLNDSNIRNVSFAFRVNKSWLTANLLDVSSVVLYRNPGTGWAPVATTLANQDSLYYYFDSSSPGFSDYAIFAGQAVPCNFGDLRCTLNESQICSVNKFWVDNQNCLGGCLDGKCVSQSQTISSTTQGLFERAKSFFNSITPAFFRAGSWGYLFYYLLLIMIVLGIIVVSFLIFKTVSSKTSKNILKEVNNKDNSFKA